MSERDDQLFLAMSDGTHVPPEIAKPSSSVDNGDTICFRGRDLKACGVATELLETSFTDWGGPADPVKF